MLYAQEALLSLADSLAIYSSKHRQVLNLYDSVLHTGDLSPTLYLRAYIGSLRPLISLGRYPEVHTRADTAQKLTLRLRDTLRYAEVLSARGAAYLGQRKYAEAESLLQKALRSMEGRYDFSPAYAMLLHRMGVLRYLQEKHEEAEEWYKKALNLRMQVLGMEHPDYASTLNNLATVYQAQGRYVEAERLYLQAKDLRARALGTEHPDYASTLNNLANVYKTQGRYTEAEKLHLEVKDIRARTLGTRHPDYAITLRNLARVYKAQGRYAEAERLLLEVKAIQAQVLGIKHPDYAGTLDNLANIYFEQGRYAVAETLLMEAKAIQGRVLGTEHPDYVLILNNLAGVYNVQGRYAEAEILLLEVKMLRARLLGTAHPDYAQTLNNLTAVYFYQGRYAEAEKLLLEAKAIRAQVFGTEHPHYAQTLSNLANVYYDQGRYSEAETLLLEAKTIRARTFGIEHPYYAQTLNNLANVYYDRGRYAEAETLYLEAKTILAQVLGTEHSDYAQTLNNLANVYYDQGRYAEAETLYLEAKTILAQVLGTEHSHYYFHALYSLASLYARQGSYEQADLLWREIIQKIFTRMDRDFLHLSTALRQQLLENLLLSRIQSFQSYVAQRQTPGLVEQGYRVARSVKGLLLSSTEAMKWLVEAKKSDTTLQELYADWRQLSEQYAAFAMRDDHETAESLFTQASAVEREIIQRLPELKAFFPDLAREPLIPPLLKGEVAIELVRVPVKGGDSVLYLFYIIEGSKKPVSLYVHRVNSAWEQQGLTAYEILRSPGAALTGSAYRLLWSFIDSLLPKGIKVIYFSPDGIYYRINIASLYDGERFLIDRYDMRYVATTRRLLIKRPRLPSTKPVVIGNPDFGGHADSVHDVRQRGYRTFPAGIPPLPGAELEARGIAEVLGVPSVIGAEATEGFVKGLSSPRVLHIATHGYFMGTGKAPMLEGGLLLAQAALWDSLYPPLRVEDGRLTAQEVSTLNLLGTDLVVLSACETGLGEVKGEGLYGLQRAFLESGAKRTITALWQIDDEATQALMKDFYHRWLTGSLRRTVPPKEDAGLAIDAAFTRTLRDFRRKYPAPYYWGAFVVMR